MIKSFKKKFVNTSRAHKGAQPKKGQSILISVVFPPFEKPLQWQQVVLTLFERRLQTPPFFIQTSKQIWK